MTLASRLNSRECNVCFETKPLSDFYTSGKRTWRRCKKCFNLRCAMRLQERLKDPSEKDKWLKHRRKYIDLNREKNGTRKSPANALAKTQKAKNEWSKRNKLKRIAHHKVNSEIRAGRISPKPCESCGSNNSQAHHDDYSRPLEIMWLCPKHHGLRHRELNDLRRSRGLQA